MTKRKTKKKPSLGEAFEELEKITAEFESGEVDLEKGVPKFRRGLELAKYLKKRLTEIENEIEEIKAEFEEKKEEPREEVEKELEKAEDIEF